MRLPLVDGQGNFGSVDGDPAAAMRYTESRLARAAESLLRDIDKDTVEFTQNYDETQLEPTVLPGCPHSCCSLCQVSAFRQNNGLVANSFKHL